MSADNWTVCPKCMAKAVEDQRKKQAEVAKAYGKVPAERYLEMLRKSCVSTDVGQTFREDWGIGMSDCGEFHVHYQGACQTCGFAHEFSHEVNVLTGGEPPQEES